MRKKLINKLTNKLITVLISLVALVLLSSGCSWETQSLSVSAPPTAQSSFIFDKDGNLITVFRGEQHRINVESFADIPQIMSNAVIAIEDERFWQHSGIDLRAVLRAGLSNLNEGGVSEGGSTITQQYVGLVFLDRTDRSASRKIEELNLALQFETQYTKEFIFTEYMNLVYFGEGAYGIVAAADEYFNKQLTELTIAEAALLAGLIQAPSTYNPYDNRDTALNRRTQVLDRMLVNNSITQKQYDQARTEPLQLAERVEVLETTYDAPYFVEEVRQWILTDTRFGPTPADRATLLFEGGLRIYTTLDREVQRQSEIAVEEVINDPEGPSGAVVVIENDTGYVRALVGGRDFFGTDPSARFNLATQGGRQAGSAFKTYVLAAALEQGFQLDTLYPAPEEIVIPIPGLDEPWEVKGGPGGGTVTLREATVRSLNTVYAQLMDDVGAENGVEMARRLGVDSPLEPVLSAVLGTNDVTVMDMARAYSTLARRGVRVEPTLVTHIVDASGELLYEHWLEGDRVISGDIADQITDVLLETVNSGTGWRAQLPGIEAAGKTGTAEDFRDATFSGYTSEFTAAIWVGFPQGQITMSPPNTPVDVFGGRYPAQIWQKVMSAAHNLTGASSGEPVVESRPFPSPPVSTTTIPYFQETSVPEVIGMTVAQAQERLRETGLLTYVIYVYDPAVPQILTGNVSAQAPPKDTIVDEETFVTIQVFTHDPSQATTLDRDAEGNFILPVAPQGRARQNPAQSQNLQPNSPQNSQSQNQQPRVIELDEFGVPLILRPDA